MKRFAVIKKEGDQFCLYTKDGSKLLGCHDTEQGAIDQEHAIQSQIENAQLPVEVAASYCDKCQERTGPLALRSLQREEPDLMEAILEASRVGDVLALTVAEKAGLLVQQRQLIIKIAAGASVRMAAFEGRKHMVVPVVALVEGVIHASNAVGPELVRVDTISRSVQGWNGEPVMYNHPEEGGEKVLANSPGMLERGMIGRIFNARMDGKKLVMEAWIDPDRARRVGAGELIDRINVKQEVEVSIGAFIFADEVRGTWRGKEYVGEWTDMYPDHLAMLQDGLKGACSVEMGCGAPRAAQTAAHGGDDMTRTDRIRALLRNPRVMQTNGVISALMSANDDQLTALEAQAEKGELGHPQSWVDRLLKGIRGAVDPEGASDTDVRIVLDEALRSEPGFVGVDTVFPDDGIVVYAVMTGDRMLFQQRSYTMGEDGKVTLGDDTEEVTPVTRFEPVSREASAASGRSGSQAEQSAQENNLMTKEERVKAIVASGKLPPLFTEADLLLLPDERISALEESVNKEEPPAKEEPKAAAAVPATIQGLDIDTVNKIVAEHKAAEAAMRIDLVNRLKTAQSVYGEDRLKEMPIDQLKEVAALVGPKAAVDNSGRAMPREAAEDDDEVGDAPSLRSMLGAEKK